MIIKKLSSFVRGWIIGDFEPSLIKTKHFEIGILKHAKGEVWPSHFHKVATEYNVLVEGRMSFGDQILSPGDIFIFSPGEIAEPTFSMDCVVLCIKIPSLPGDKYIIKEGASDSLKQ